MSQKHTGNKVLQQDTIDAIERMITQQGTLLLEQKHTQTKLDELHSELKALNIQLSIVTGNTIKEKDIE